MSNNTLINLIINSEVGVLNKLSVDEAESLAGEIKNWLEDNSEPVESLFDPDEENPIMVFNLDHIN